MCTCGIDDCKSAKVGSGNYSLGTAGRLTASFAKKFYLAGSKGGLSAVKGPTVKKRGQLAGSNVYNFERYTKKPISRKSYQWPNRAGSGHLKIKGWW